MITAKIIADSISVAGHRLTTFELVYPRYIHAELMTHRVFSRNAASSRAIPIADVIKLVREDTAMPIWTSNQSGMQGKFITNGTLINDLNNIWVDSARGACIVAEELAELGAHKQNVNRVLEPYQHIKVIVTATNYHNWFSLRQHKDAQPEIEQLAIKMAASMHQSKPVTRKNTWHLPYVDEPLYLECVKEASRLNGIAKTPAIEALDIAKQISASCCAQVSYRKLDDSIEKALSIYKALVGGEPLHASPFEHQATPCLVGTEKGNFTGWAQYRREIEDEAISGTKVLPP